MLEIAAAEFINGFVDDMIALERFFRRCQPLSAPAIAVRASQSERRQRNKSLLVVISR
jgi:hypothetical protein